MKKLSLFVLMIAFGLLAKAQNDVVITWLPDNAAVATKYGYTSSATLTVCIEFGLEDLLNYKSTKKALDTIKQVQFNIDNEYFSAVTACNVIIMQGDDLKTATEVVHQVVDVNNLVGEWNYVDLDDAYAIDSTKRLYIGYQLSFTGRAYPFPLATVTNLKQSWIRLNTGEFQNLSGGAFFIKAVATTKSSPDNEIKLTSLNIVKYNNLGDNLAIKGSVKNLGVAPITSFNVSYELNGTQSSLHTVTGVNILPNASYNFTHPDNYPINSIFSNQVIVRVFEPNGITDMEFNNTMETDVRVYSSSVQRVVLHEVFTSSTCPPCNQGNVQLKNVLDQVDTNKWACIKYQYNFPGLGDPYFTEEGYARATFYKGISSVPTLFGDGSAHSGNPYAYTVSEFNKLEAIPSLATMTASAAVNEKTVELSQITINPVTNMNNPNLRFFAAIVEKRTFKNVKTNGEHEFRYVMKKFMTSVDGDVIAALIDNQSISLNNYSYTFKGNYRLPLFSTTRDVINHAIEHSVEDFKALMVVFWLQDISTGEVFQAGKADPYPGYMPVSIADINPDNSINAYVYPNPVQDVLYINADANIERVEIYNIQGQLIKMKNTNISEISTMDLSNGLYMLRITSDKGVSTHKFIKQ
jgi:hypothetical protein